MDWRFFFVVSFGIIYSLFFSGYFSISNISVEGENEELKEITFNSFKNRSEKKLLGVIPRTTIISSFGSLKEETLKNYPKIKNLFISSDLPDSMSIKIETRSYEGVWCSSGIRNSCFFYGSDGVIFENAPNSTRGFLLRFVKDRRSQGAKLGDKVLSEEDIAQIDLLYKALTSGIERPIHISVYDSVEIRAKFIEGWEAYFSRNKPIAESVENVASILEERVKNRRNELEYIDARFGNRLFYRYKTIELPDAPLLDPEEYQNPLSARDEEEVEELDNQENGANSDNSDSQ